MAENDWKSFKDVVRPDHVVSMRIPTGVSWTVEGLDPYLLFADAMGYGGGSDANATELDCLIEMIDEPGADRATGIPLYDAWLRSKRTPEVFRKALEDLRERGYWVTPAYLGDENIEQRRFSATALIPKADLLLSGRKAECAGFRLTYSPDAVAPTMARTIGIDRPGPERIGGAGKPVIAIIDIGCAFAHRQFRIQPGDASRVRYVWDQGFAPRASDPAWRTPLGMAYGRELKGSKLDALLLDARFRLSGGQVDEAALYGELLYPGYRTRPGSTGIGADPPLYAAPLPRVTHGACVMGLAGGDPHPLKPGLHDRAGGAELIVVNLPRDAVRDTTGASFIKPVRDALRYIFDRVKVDSDLVINLSYGAAAGAHDGTTMVEKAFLEAFADRNEDFMLTLPAGNLRDARMHATLPLHGQTRGTFTWDIPAGSGTPSYLECWPRSHSKDPPQLRARILPPRANPATVPWIPLNQSALLQPYPPSPPQCGGIYVDLPPNALSGSVALFAVGPTDSSQPNQPEPGRWVVEIENLGKDDCTIEGWIQRNDPTYGSTGRQARFARRPDVVPANEARVSQRGTLSEIANLDTPVVVGAYRMRPPPQLPSEDYEPSPYSSEGFVPPPARKRERPSASAPGDESAVVDGLNVPASAGVGWVRMNGTSVAAPLAARALINLMVSPVPDPTLVLHTRLDASVRKANRNRTVVGEGFVE